MGVSLSRLQNVSFQTLFSSEATMQAQHHAKTKMDYLVFCGYNALAEQPKTSIQGSSFKDSVALGTVSTDSNGISRRMVTINVFHDDEVKPRATLEQVFYSNDANKYVTNGSSATSSISMHYDAENDKLYAKVNGVEKLLGSGVPVGTVIIWASNNTPTEGGSWLECNGQDCSTYPKLVAVLGKSTVPDYRGVFLRGLGSQSFSQNNGSIIGVTSTVYTSGNLGEIQGDATRIVTGYFSFADGMDVRPRGVFCNSGVANGENISRTSDVNKGLDNPCFDNSRVVPIANEIRPVNIAVRYFIKAA